MKSNVLFRTAVATAVLAVVGITSANAGTVTVASRNVAQEAFGTAVTAATVVATNTNGVSYVFATPGGIVINSGGQVTVTLTPTGGKLDQSALLALQMPAGTGGDLTTSTAAVDGTTGEIVITVKNSGANNAVLGVGATIIVGGTTSDANGGAGSTGKVTVTNALGLATGTSVTVSGKVTSGTTTLEAPSVSANVLTSSMAVTTLAVNSADFQTSPETVKIDLRSTPTAGTRLIKSDGVTQTQIETLGSVTFTDSGTAAQELATTNAVNVANTAAFANTSNYDLTLVSGNFTAGTTFSLNSAASCAALSTIASTPTYTPVTQGVTASTTKVSLASTTRPVTGIPVYLCASYGTTTAISANQLTVLGKLDKASTAYLDKNFGPTSLYKLVNNGAVVEMQNYIPAAVTGYLQTVRVINSGNTDAQLFVSLIDETTGIAGSSLPIGGILKASGTVRLSQAAIEAVVGVQPSNVRPRLSFTAQTSGLKIQSLFNNANGAYTNLSGVEQ